MYGKVNKCGYSGDKRGRRQYADSGGQERQRERNGRGKGFHIATGHLAGRGGRQNFKKVAHWVKELLN
jgi:hypothetical protein